MAIIHNVPYLLVTSPIRLVTSPTCADMANKWEKVVTLLTRTSSNLDAFRYVSNKPAKFGYPCIRPFASPTRTSIAWMLASEVRRAG